ncbi:PE domain-containing protein [Mycobacterium gordonae]|uniref:PE domain-containing protein n=1 Tax=Mycobacterium gordonae TaxID=1778 RepID=UPI00210A5714|nr:PE domain-containing protein [Mycobacterium gordonae]MCQ4365150.1 PE domain-containing protein [Mycobacterium gordonae]
MSFVVAALDMIETAAADAGQIGSAVGAGNLAAAIPTTQLAAAAADEVSVAIASLFGTHATDYRAAAAQAAVYHQEFVKNLGAAAASYGGAEAAILAQLEATLLGGGFAAAPVEALNEFTSGAFQALVYKPVHQAGQAWIASPFGQAVDPIVNAPTQALFGRDLIGNGAAGTAAQPNGGAGGAGTPTGAFGTRGFPGLFIGLGGSTVPVLNDQLVTIEFVRHGQTASNVAGLLDTAVPGPPLDATGVLQAANIANVLNGQGIFGGIFDSQMLRTQETAAALVAYAGQPAALVLPGLNEINAGLFEDLPQIPAGLLYLGGPLVWTLGLPAFPMLVPLSTNPTGLNFAAGFNSAVQTMYNVGAADPSHAVVAYSSALTIETGTMMMVDNPNPLFLLTRTLPNTGVVVVQGSPATGWTMVSYDGVPVGPASLPTQLFVDVRNFVTAPQYAGYDLGAAVLTGNPATIVNAVRDGVREVTTATVHFPFALAETLLGA